MAEPAPVSSVAASITVPDDGLDFERTVGGIERHILHQALRKGLAVYVGALADPDALARDTLEAAIAGLRAGIHTTFKTSQCHRTGAIAVAQVEKDNA